MEEYTYTVMSKFFYKSQNIKNSSQSSKLQVSHTLETVVRNIPGQKKLVWKSIATQKIGHTDVMPELFIN